MIDVDLIRSRYASLLPHLDERGRRLFAATEARAAGHGGIVAVSRATGIAPSTIGRGLRELDEADPLPPGWVRREGGGRKTLVETGPGLLDALLALVRPTERGDPESPLRWTCLSLRQLEAALKARGHPVSHMVVGTLLKAEGFSLQANQKTLEGSSHPNRDAQFRHLNESVRAALAVGEPVISVDTKKKELVGDFKNAGRAWRPQGEPEEVRVHDFLIKELGRVVGKRLRRAAGGRGIRRGAIGAAQAEFAPREAVGQQVVNGVLQILLAAEDADGLADRGDEAVRICLRRVGHGCLLLALWMQGEAWRHGTPTQRGAGSNRLLRSVAGSRGDQTHAAPTAASRSPPPATSCPGRRTGRRSGSRRS